MSDSITPAGEKLLSTWLRLSSALWNTRLVTFLTYNETHVLGILYKHIQADAPLTATDLIAETRLLKSQMNKLLTELESKGYILRTRCEDDRRKVRIQLTESGVAAYLNEHSRIISLLTRLVNEIGEERILRVCQDVDDVTLTIDRVLDNM